MIRAHTGQQRSEYWPFEQTKRMIRDSDDRPLLRNALDVAAGDQRTNLEKIQKMIEDVPLVPAAPGFFINVIKPVEKKDALQGAGEGRRQSGGNYGTKGF